MWHSWKVARWDDANVQSVPEGQTEIVEAAADALEAHHDNPEHLKLRTASRQLDATAIKCLM